MQSTRYVHSLQSDSPVVRAFSVLINSIQQSHHPGQHYLRRNVRQPHGNRIVRHILAVADRRTAQLPLSLSPSLSLPLSRSLSFSLSIFLLFPITLSRSLFLSSTSSPLLFRNFADSSPDRQIRTSSECQSTYNAPLKRRVPTSRGYFSRARLRRNAEANV